MSHSEAFEGLRIVGLDKRYGDVHALRGVDLEVPRGQLVGFLGANGAGKTTAMRSVVGLVSVDGGTISWNGRPISRDDRRHIGYMPQERGLYHAMGVHEHIAYIGRLAGLDTEIADSRADYWIERVGLADRRDDQIQTLSTGNQQRVQLAMALVHEPNLMLLDEPFAGLDPVAVQMLSDVMTEKIQNGVSVVFSSHQMDLVQDIAEQVSIVANGTTQATGTVSELRNRSPHRHLKIQWASEVPEWQPDEAEVLPASRGSSHFVVPATSDGGALIARAAAAGTIAAVTYEAPGLEEVFIDVVGS